MMPRLLLLICALISSSTLLADDNDRQYNLVRLQAQQSESVSNDTMHVTLNTYAEMKNASKLAARINGDMEWALALAKQDPAIKVRTGGYQTWPVTRKDVTSTWRGSQDLILESLDTERLSELTGKLQAKLQVKSMNFTVSDEKRRCRKPPYRCGPGCLQGTCRHCCQQPVGQGLSHRRYQCLGSRATPAGHVPGTGGHPGDGLQ